MSICVGIAGGSGSGKTTLAHALAARLPGQTAIIEHDSYYRDQSALSFAERQHTNYDHPDALDNELLLTQLETLLAGRPVDAPVYDFREHLRAPETRRVLPRPVIILEGIHVLGNAALRERMALRIFVDAPADLRFIRRLQRDLLERGRSAQSVIDQYLGQVRPMHEAWVEPARAYADIVMPQNADDWGMDELVSVIAARCRA